MALRIDHDLRLIVVSVSEFIAQEEFFRIGFDRGDGLRRLRVGQAIHSRYQDQRMAEEPSFRREVPYRFELPCLGWTIRIHGRIDGFWKDDQGVQVVEEVKSCSFAMDGDPISNPSPKQERARRQLLTYCHGISHQGAPVRDGPAGPRALVPVHALLIYVDVATGEIRRMPVPWDPVELGDWVTRRAEEIVERIGQAAERARRRRQAAGKVPFPHAVTRPGQDLLVAAVDRALSQKEFLLACAPTGIGKTAGVLHPSVRNALRTNRKLFVLTAKGLQQPLAVQTLERMEPSAWSVVHLRAKSKMCANGQVVCHEQLCNYARDYPEKMESSGLVDSLIENHPVLDPDLIYEAACEVEVCPFEVSLELASRAEVVVADYNYVFHPDVALRDAREDEGLERAFLVVDEAHNLVDRARQIHSPAIGVAQIRAVESYCRLRSDELFFELGECLLELIDAIVEIADDTLGIDQPGEAMTAAPTELFNALHLRLDELVARYLAWKRETLSYEEHDPVLEVFFQVVKMVRLLPKVGEDLVVISSRNDADTKLGLFCLEPARFLEPIWKSAAGGVLMSATLEPFDFYGNLLGLPGNRTGELSLESPFPPENRRVLVVPSVSTTWRNRPRDAARTTDLIADLTRVTPGNVLALFPSYRFLRDITSRLEDLGKELVVQEPDLSVGQRRGIIEKLTRAPAEGVLLAAVSGGLFAEGIDYPDELLKSVLVISPSLPQVSFQRELLKQFYEERYGRGFDFAYLVPGMRRVIQSAGRIIRSERDRGVVALICRRFSQHQYRSYLPDEWFVGEEPVSLPALRAVRAAEEFFLRDRGAIATRPFAPDTEEDFDGPT